MTIREAAPPPIFPQPVPYGAARRGVLRRIVAELHEMGAGHRRRYRLACGHVVERARTDRESAYCEYCAEAR